ncbi:uncharacterized protein LOC125044845 [Penaeus chinensis]|uniref:uncharacterized protein LOC125044845 n=1 Tax=Penaeus chinensis TaxID=139456 RepID=UPI001FB64EC4|nr:uncharacterized protein LOC125044845 [Penaeus chinensis]
METLGERDGHIRGTPLVRVHSYGRAREGNIQRQHTINIDERRLGRASGVYSTSRPAMASFHGHHSHVAMQHGVQVCGAMMYFYAMFKLGIVGAIFLIVGIINVGMTSTASTRQNYQAQNALATVGKVFIGLGVIILFICLLLGCIGRRRYKDVEERLRREVNAIRMTQQQSNTLFPHPDMYPGQAVFHTRSSMHGSYPQNYPDQPTARSDYTLTRTGPREGEAYITEERSRAVDKDNRGGARGS